MLKKDHEAVKTILGQLVQTKESAPKKREVLFQRLRMALVPHMKAEESFQERERGSEQRASDIMKQFELEKQAIKKNLR